VSRGVVYIRQVLDMLESGVQRMDVETIRIDGESSQANMHTQPTSLRDTGRDIDGMRAQENRGYVVRRFQEDPSVRVALLSIKVRHMQQFPTPAAARMMPPVCRRRAPVSRSPRRTSSSSPNSHGIRPT